MLPVAANPIVNSATKEGLQWSRRWQRTMLIPLQEEDLTDRLQVSIKNTSAGTLSDLEVFYQMTDSVTKKTEGYYQKLTGFTLAAGQTVTVYFDSEAGVGHYPEDAYSLYRTSKNEVHHLHRGQRRRIQAGDGRSHEVGGNRRESRPMKRDQ